MTTTAPPPTRPPGWIAGWDPENREFWHQQGRRIAHRNLAVSILSEHIGFSVWSIWSVLVLFLSPETGFPFTAGEKFLLVTTPALVGALLRVPYSYAVSRFGGRNWTVVSSAVLLVPAFLAWYFVQQPGTPLWVFLLVGALTGLGGGNFASSMTNIAGFFPQRHQGWALGVNAGGGNLGVAVVQLVGLVVIATAGNTSPSLVAGIYLPLVAIATLAAAWKMDNIDAVRADAGAQRHALREPHTWAISVLYVGTFGSFVGYSFAFGLVLQNQFDASPWEAMSYTFLGPLLGSLSRPVGGWLADRWGGADVTLWVFVGLAAGTGVLLAASSAESFPMFVAAFTLLFVLTGVGNGSVYKLIPVVFRRQAERAEPALGRTRDLTGAVIGIAGAVGALGGVFITLTFRASYSGVEASGDAAFLTFLAFYAVCVVLTWTVYSRPSAGDARA